MASVCLPQPGMASLIRLCQGQAPPQPRPYYVRLQQEVRPQKTHHSIPGAQGFKRKGLGQVSSLGKIPRTCHFSFLLPVLQARNRSAGSRHSLLLLKLLYSDLLKSRTLGSCQGAPLSPQAPPQSASPFSAPGSNSKEPPLSRRN